MIIPITKEDLVAYNYAVLPFVILGVIALIFFAFFNVLIGFYIFVVKLKVENNTHRVTEIHYTGNVCKFEPKTESQPQKTKADEFIKPTSVIEVDIIAQKGVPQLELQISRLLVVLDHASYLLSFFIALILFFMGVHLVTNVIFDIENFNAHILSLNENDTYNDTDGATSSHEAKPSYFALKIKWHDIFFAVVLTVPFVFTSYVLYGGITKYTVWRQTQLLMFIPIFEIASVADLILNIYCSFESYMDVIHLASKSFRVLLTVYVILMLPLINACRVVAIELFYVKCLFPKFKINYKSI